MRKILATAAIEAAVATVLTGTAQTETNLDATVRVGLAGTPLSEEFAYRLTDAGHDALARWYRLVGSRREEPDFKPFWDVVTLMR